MKGLNEEQKQAYKVLREQLKKHKKIYTILRHVSNSGMFRLISVFVCDKDEVLNLDYYIGKLGIAKRDKREGLRVSGCGMDMGFHLVDNVFKSVFGYKYEWQKNHRQEWV